MILVSGGTGFIGHHLIRHLIKQKQRTRVLVRRKGQIEQIGENVLIDPFFGDITDFSSLKGIMQDVDVVFHLASVINAKKETREVYWNTNVLGTQNLLNAIQRENGKLKRFVFCSSVGVMGPLKSLPADENTTCAPHNLYEKSKYEAEEIVRDFHKREGMPITIVRPSWVYGPGDMRTLKLFQAINRERFIIIGDGNTLIHPVYVEDVVRALMFCVFEPKSEGQVYIIAGKKALPLRELVHIIAENLNAHIPKFYFPLILAKMIAIPLEIIYKPFSKRPPLSRRRLEFFSKDQFFDITKAQNEIGYYPEFDLTEGINRTIRWYRENHYL